MVALTTEGALLLGTLGVLCEYCGHSAQLMWMLGLCVPQSCSSVVGVRNREVQFGSGACVLQSTAFCIGHHIAALAYAPIFANLTRAAKQQLMAHAETWGRGQPARQSLMILGHAHHPNFFDIKYCQPQRSGP